MAAITERFACTQPEQQGVSSRAILNFVEAVERKRLALHSFMLVRHGAKIAEGWWQPYAPHLKHMLFSLSKSFTSSAVGLAAAEGLLTVEDLVVSFFAEDLPAEVDPNLAQMRVKHLLTMSTGHAEDTTGRMVQSPDGNWVKAFLSLPVENIPGAPFVYNSGASYMLSAIVQKVTGQTLLDYLRPRLFEPLGIENPTWESCPRGINTGGWGLSIHTEDIASFGQMYLQKGVWKGQRILPEAWVAEATRAQVPNGTDPNSDWAQGYGYQFWRCRHNNYRGDGAFGQYCIVMPDQDAVLAITSGVGDMQAVMNQAWTHLLPAMQDQPLRANPRANAKLQEKLSSLALRDFHGAPSSPAEQKFAGHYLLKENPNNLQALDLLFDEQTVIVRAQVAAGTADLVAGRDEWVLSESTFYSRDGEPLPLAAKATWPEPETLQVTVRSYTTPFTFTMRLRFQKDTLVVRQSADLSLGRRAFPILRGRKAAV